MLMATQKKNPDASEAALSAIEEALGLGGKNVPAGSEAAKPPQPEKPGDGAPRLPRVEENELFKTAPPKETPPEARLEIKAPPRKVQVPLPKLPEPRLEAPARPAAPLPPPAAPPAPAAPATPAAPPAPDSRRGTILPANDDRRASVQQLLEPLRQASPRTAYWLAVVFSGLWVAGAWILLSKPDGVFFTAESALRPGIELPLALAGIGIVLPVLFVFALAALHRRSRDLRNSARVMAEVAARLAEPESVGADAVFTLGQAVRREVASIGDGVERALSRAAELESIVHGEVSALERSYADNEYKMRQLVAELAAEREAIMATADRIRNSIDAAHQGFSSDIGKAGDSISRAIDEAGERVTVLIGGKQEELISTLDRSAVHAGDLIRSRTSELSETLSSAAAETNGALESTASAIVGQLNNLRQALLNEIERVSGGATNGLDEASRLVVARLAEQADLIQREIVATSEIAADAMRSSGSALTSEWDSATSEAARQLAEMSQNASQSIRETSIRLTGEWENATRTAAERLSEVSDNSTRLIRETGATLWTDFTQAAEVVHNAFQSNSREIIDTIGSRAAAVNDTMRSASQDFISAIENRGADTAKLIEQKGSMVVEALTSRSDELAERMLGTASRIEETLGTTSRAISGVMEDSTLRIETTMSQGASEFDSLLTGNARRLAETFGVNGQLIETTLQRSISRIEETLAEKSRTFETALESARGGLESALADQGSALVNLITNRITQANEAFTIAGESLGTLIADRTREASSGLRTEIDELGLTLARQTTEATERLAATGRDVLQAMNTHGTRVNEALASNATRLAETVTQRATDLNQRFDEFEKAFVTTADKLENTVMAQSEVIGTRIADRTIEVTSHIEGLLNRVETGVDERARTISDMVALRTLEFTRVVQETGGNLLGNLEQKVQVFGKQVVNPLGEQLATLDRKTREATEELGKRAIAITEAFDHSTREATEQLSKRAIDVTDTFGQSAQQVRETLDRSAHEITVSLETSTKQVAETIDLRTRAVAETLETKTRQATDGIIGRLDQSAGAIVLRAAEVERSLTSLSREVGSELMNRAEQISQLIDSKGSHFISSFEQHGLAMVRGLETASNEIAVRVTSSLAELDSAIENGSAKSLHNLVEANDKLRDEVVGLLDKLGEANRVLNTIVGSTAKGLSEVEGRLGDRVRGLEATLAAILSAANEGSDALSARVEAIRSVSGDLLANSQSTVTALDSRAEVMRALSNELTVSQSGLANLLGERQQAFENLVGTLNARIEDVDAMLRSFTSLVDDQLTAAEARARDTSNLVQQSAETASHAIGSQFERIRLETGKERERTAAALRQAYDQVNTEFGALLQNGVQGFLDSASDLRRATRDILADLEATRAALGSVGLEIPREAREATQNLKRVMGDQMRALSELNEIVARSGPALDVAEPRRLEAEVPRAAPRPAPYEPPPRQAPPPPPRPASPPPPPRSSSPAPGGGSWLSGLLERASDDEPMPPSRPMRSPDPMRSPNPMRAPDLPRGSDMGSARRIESLDSLSVDIARMIDHDAAIELWDRYRRGERNVFTRKLYTLQGQEAYDDIRRRYRRDAEFKHTVDTYVDQFERLLAEVAGDDRDSLVARTYLTSDTGKVYTMLAHAAGRFD
jgi:hypothetical protein